MSHKRNVLVTLSCGCKIRTRSFPLPGTRLACASGKGHGYRLDWVEAAEGTRHHMQLSTEPAPEEAT